MNTENRIEINITDIGTQGEGIGKSGGLAVFIPGALPGDRVLAEITEKKPNFARARIVEIIEASPDRVESDCPHSGYCGGCSLREYSYEAQLKWKEKHVRDTLVRIGGLENPLVHPCVGMDEPFRYRNKAEFAVDKSSVGYYEAGSHKLVTFKDCLIQSKPAVELARAFEAFLKKYPKNIYRGLVVRTSSDGSVMAIIVANKNEMSRAEELVYALEDAVSEPFFLESVILNINKKPGQQLLGPDCIPIAGSRVISDEIITELSTIKTEVSPLAFYQVNPRQCTKLYSKAQEYAALKGDETVLDLYCGAGSIGLSMAGNCRRVIGVESVKPAVIDANRNAVINGIVNAEFICGKAEEVVEKRLSGVKADVVILDPPRAGCDRALLETVEKIGPERIVYISCNPATLARDLKILTAGGYEFIEATPFDMFCFSTHVETVVLLSKG